MYFLYYSTYNTTNKTTVTVSRCHTKYQSAAFVTLVTPVS